jgi:hypothetical protein
MLDACDDEEEAVRRGLMGFCEGVAIAALLAGRPADSRSSSADGFLLLNYQQRWAYKLCVRVLYISWSRDGTEELRATRLEDGGGS